jgi:phosphatidylserine/phosphatidylglycerophosphate/cardiolipin synthase-like enzyme
MTAEDAAARGVEEFLHDSWPSGGTIPAIYFVPCPRTVAPGSKINLHAKCVIVDGRHVLIGSANFTHNAHVRSIELGVLIEDVSLATELTRQRQGLIDSGLVAAFNHS